MYHISIYAQNGRVGPESARRSIVYPEQVDLPDRYDVAGGHANQDYVLDEKHSQEDQCQDY
jgi:hypothetical protein